MRKHLLHILFLTSLFACTDKLPKEVSHAEQPDTLAKAIVEPTIISNIKYHSRYLKDSVVKMTGIETQDLTPVDSLVLQALKKFEQFNSDSCDCIFRTYYYGYLDSDENYLKVLFAKTTVTDAGDEQLFLAHIDNTGNVIDIIDVAQNTSAAECTITEESLLKANELRLYFREMCPIFENADVIGDRIDSVTYIYSISNTGKFVFKKSSKRTVEQLDQ